VNPKANVPFSETQVWALLDNNLEPNPMWAEMHDLKEERAKARTRQQHEKEEEAVMAMEEGVRKEESLENVMAWCYIRG